MRGRGPSRAQERGEHDAAHQRLLAERRVSARRRPRRGERPSGPLGRERFVQPAERLEVSRAAGPTPRIAARAGPRLASQSEAPAAIISDRGPRVQRPPAEAGTAAGDAIGGERERARGRPGPAPPAPGPGACRAEARMSVTKGMADRPTTTAARASRGGSVARSGTDPPVSISLALCPRRRGRSASRPSFPARRILPRSQSSFGRIGRAGITSSFWDSHDCGYRERASAGGEEAAARLRAAHRVVVAHRGRDLRGERRADVPRPGRPVAAVPAGGPGHAGGVRARPAARLGVVRVAARARSRRLRPNAAHVALAALERRVAGVPARHPERRRPARARRAAGACVELHGSLWRLRCTACGARRATDRAARPAPSCRRAAPAARCCAPTSSGSARRCAETRSSAASRPRGAAEAVLVVGTSSLVYPAAALPQVAARRRGLRHRGQPGGDAADAAGRRLAARDGGRAVAAAASWRAPMTQSRAPPRSRRPAPGRATCRRRIGRASGWRGTGARRALQPRAAGAGAGNAARAAPPPSTWPEALLGVGAARPGRPLAGRAGGRARASAGPRPRACWPRWSWARGWPPRAGGRRPRSARPADVGALSPAALRRAAGGDVRHPGPRRAPPAQARGRDLGRLPHLEPGASARGVPGGGGRARGRARPLPQPSLGRSRALGRGHRRSRGGWPRRARSWASRSSTTSCSAPAASSA